MKMQLFFICVFATTNILAQNKITSNELTQLVNFMEGNYTSQLQSENDTDYYNITLHMKRIWVKEYPTENWLYVEQTLTSTPDKPYRQRIYRVTQPEEELFESEVLNILNDSLVIGAWKNEDLLKGLTKESLDLKEGCSVFLKYNGAGIYEGETNDKTCESKLRGATYAVSHVTVLFDKIVSWDQGFDNEGKQVWGATKGGYQFIKQKM
jgi:CpeT protein